MNAARLYCQGACPACSALARSLTDAGVALVVHDVTVNHAAYDAVIALGYRSLPVLVGPRRDLCCGASRRRAGPRSQRCNLSGF